MPRHLSSLPMRNVIVTVNEQLLMYFFLRIRKSIIRMHPWRGAHWLGAASANHLALSLSPLHPILQRKFPNTAQIPTYISYLQVSYSLILILLGSEYIYFFKIKFSFKCFKSFFFLRLHHHTHLRGQCSFRIRAFCGIGLTKWNMASVW